MFVYKYAVNGWLLRRHGYGRQFLSSFLCSVIRMCTAHVRCSYVCSNVSAFIYFVIYANHKHVLSLALTLYIKMEIVDRLFLYVRHLASTEEKRIREMKIIVSGKK